MQDITIRHDVCLPAPYSITEFDGYLRIEVNPAMMARIPIWLREVLENGALGCVKGPPSPGVAEPQVVAAQSNVIDITAARASRAV